MSNKGDKSTYIYWEPQVAGLCGCHCLNTLLQSPVISPGDLAEIAHRLDALEQTAMAEDGVDTADYLKYLAEDSGNVAQDGNFSVQVLSEALKVWGVEVISIKSPDAKEIRANPLKQEAYILNLGNHWFTVRKIAGVFWNLNSMNKNGPEEVGDFYLSLLFDTLMQEGYSIFAIVGELPVFGDAMRGESFNSGGGKWMLCRPKSAGGGGGGGGGWGHHNDNNNNDDFDEDWELAEAIKASLESGTKPTTTTSSSSSSVSVVSSSHSPKPKNDGDSDVERALALSRALDEEEPKEGSDASYVVQIKLAGQTLKRAWRADAKIQILYDWVFGTTGAQGTLVEMFPERREFTEKDATLKSVFLGSKRVSLNMV